MKVDKKHIIVMALDITSMILAIIAAIILRDFTWILVATLWFAILVQDHYSYEEEQLSNSIIDKQEEIIIELTKLIIVDGLNNEKNSEN